MEGDVVVNIAKDLSKAGVVVGRMVGDDDSSAIKHLREEFGHDTEKSSDINH